MKSDFQTYYHEYVFEIQEMFFSKVKDSKFITFIRPAAHWPLTLFYYVLSINIHVYVYLRCST